jgi:hypothetical protein
MLPLFPLGQIVATPGALAALEREQQRNMGGATMSERCFESTAHRPADE